MEWQVLAHGWNGVLLAVGLTAVPLWAALIQCRAPFVRWLQSPLFAVMGAIVGALLAGALRAWLEGSFGVSDESRSARIVSVTTFLLVGYGVGRFLSRTSPAEAHKRGSVIADGTAAQRETARRLKRHGDAFVTLAGIAIAPEDETKHFKLIGTTGTGKSTAIREVLRTALARGDRAIIADPDGGFLARFHERFRGDVILNPFDAQSATWDLFAEIEQPYDIDQLARALIADCENPSAREWRGYARTFLSAVIRKTHEEGSATVAELWRRLAVAPVDELAPLLAGTPAQPYLAPDSARMFGSLRSVAVSATAGLDCIAAQRTSPFSIRQWVRSGQGALFIPYQAGQIAALRSVISAWLRVAIFEAMNQRVGDQRLWFIVDELDALGVSTASRTRSHGCANLAAVASWASSPSPRSRAPTALAKRRQSSRTAAIPSSSAAPAAKAAAPHASPPASSANAKCCAPQCQRVGDLTHGSHR